MRRGKYRGKGWGEKKEKTLKRALGVQTDDIVPHIVGRGRWLGMRDYAPELNGPVRVRKEKP